MERQNEKAILNGRKINENQERISHLQGEMDNSQNSVGENFYAVGYFIAVAVTSFLLGRYM